MEVDLLRLIITNLPNFAGFAVLAFVQWSTSKRQDEQYDALLKEFLELLRDCNESAKSIRQAEERLTRN